MSEQDLSRIIILVQSYILAVFTVQDSKIGSRWHTLPQIGEILEALLGGERDFRSPTYKCKKVKYIYIYIAHTPTLEPKISLTWMLIILKGNCQIFTSTSRSQLPEVVPYYYNKYTVKWTLLWSSGRGNESLSTSYS